METSVLNFNCPKCKIKSQPFGLTPQRIPYSASVICPTCGYEEHCDWFDSETHKLVLQNKYLKTKESDLTPQLKILEGKIQVLETGRDADRKEIQNLRQLIDLAIKKDIQELKEKASGQEYDKNFLQDQITKLQETFDKISSWQKKQDG